METIISIKGQFFPDFFSLYLTNDWALDWNILGAYTGGGNEDRQQTFKKFPHEHIADTHY